MKLTWNTLKETAPNGCFETSSFETVSGIVFTVSRDSLTIEIFGQVASPEFYAASQCDPYDSGWGSTYMASYAYTETSFTFTEVQPIADLQEKLGTRTATVTAQLSDPYTTAELYEDAVELLAEWDMADSVLYPVRQDKNVTVAPYVKYDEGYRTMNVGTCTQDTSSTGAVMGSPGPRGIDKVWAPHMENYCSCTEDQGDRTCTNLYVDTIGQWSTEAPTGIPAAATNWMNDRLGNALPQGAFSLMNQIYNSPGTCNPFPYNRISDGTLYLCKRAQYTYPKPSINYARPCNTDRLQISQSLARCVVDVVGNVVTVETGDVLPSGSYWWISGTSVDGLYSATRDSNYQLTLTECLLSASATFYDPFFDSGEGMVAPLRWQNTENVSGICGRVDVIEANNSNPVTCSLAEPCVLLNGDMLMVVNAIGNNINGNWNIEVIDDRTIALLECDGTAASPYTGSGQAYSIWGADWRWNDSLRKGDYTVTVWNHEYRERDEWIRTHLINKSCTLHESV